jgi:large subunit ribosomal protein L13
VDTAPKTHFYKPEEVERKWFLVDANGKNLGRLASRVAHILRGKHKPAFTPNFDVGDHVIVINADKVMLTGKRTDLKEYYHNTMYPGGARFESFREMISMKPEWVFERAVKGMLPHNRLGRRMLLKLKVYRGATHPHSAQEPTPLTFED